MDRIELQCRIANLERDKKDLEVTNEMLREALSKARCETDYETRYERAIAQYPQPQDPYNRLEPLRRAFENYLTRMSSN